MAKTDFTITAFEAAKLTRMANQHHYENRRWRLDYDDDGKPIIVSDSTEYGNAAEYRQFSRSDLNLVMVSWGWGES